MTLVDIEHPVEEYLRFIKVAREEMGWIETHPDWAYSCYEAFVLDQGRPYDGEKRPKGLRKRANRMCFRNTLQLVMNRPDLRYVEGYADGVIPVMHAWAIDSDDRVIDLTWKNPEESHYYGVVIPTETVMKLGFLHRFYGVLGNDYRLGAPILKYGTFLPPEE